MLNIQRSTKDDRTCKAVTGITREEFRKLERDFAEEYEQYMRSEYKKEEHQRSYGGGETPKLATAEEKL